MRDILLFVRGYQNDRSDQRFTISTPSGLERLPTMRTYHPPFVTGETLKVLYPELEPLLKTIPNHVEGNEHVYNAFIALDIVNELRRMATLATRRMSKQPGGMSRYSPCQ